jgi:hypothetical protein
VIVEKVERREIVASARVILTAFTGAKEDTAIVTGRGLAGLHIETIGVQRDFSADSYAALVISQVESAGREAERIGEAAKLAARVEVEFALGVFVVGDAFAEIKTAGIGIGHGELSESGDGQAQQRALSRGSGFTRLPAVLFLSGRAGRRRWRVQASSPASAKNSAIRSCVDLPRMRSAVISTAIPPNPSGRGAFWKPDDPALISLPGPAWLGAR